MSEQDVDKSRRRFLTAATSVVGAIGVTGVALPFVFSMNPSAKAKAAGAPVEVDFSKLEPGQMVILEWRKKPVMIVRRTEKNLQDLAALEPKLADIDSKQSNQPAYALNKNRSIKPEYLVMVGICTHLGCVPKFRPEVAPEDLGTDWLGGFFCPCHGSRFDLSGRVYSGVPAPTNMDIPPYKYLTETSIIIGVDEGAEA